ncbi:1-deoxy-D-xylulose-5-phosphate reductoisomerase [Desulfolutivibrio sulfoxidireducens]|uniref:1-deoxy-D-xylulose-5-phosphate reductoisomerase n=1 Tax=Desulfolutivibrio sulfoxidireducens TaxID=2773299 RepID=UPI00159D29E3|nr:1-deoxy-D-xylulose-5-phosphate reductoisomerase [Desulfolutivibrio sulfoxidireducens]QLA15148.1 1-deoxy-D-xylulose-5-phosphate reductoisomerase [Desulfolutivibrio sulfoxidireducens]QLA18719.1 1-deoxy-D-xylulose-5-phosphate reductoisomerase [Desulfolutivibrio sulfoxidireducens]
MTDTAAETAPASPGRTPGQGYISALPEPDGLPGFPRALCVLGSTGSIGTSALSVAAKHPDRFTVAALAGARNIDLLARQAEAFRPPRLGVLDASGADELSRRLSPGYRPDIVHGAAGYAALAADPGCDVVLSAIVGAAGLGPTLAAVRAGKVVALANKESLVLAGDLIRAACRTSGAVILPVDSEHNALFQALGGPGLRELPDVASLVLTASGGPFRDKPAAFLETVTRAQALSHPNWSMGPKISVDSATLMNKGLEVIEACRLFGLPPDRVEVVVHPQSIVHSLARYHDGSLLAHLGPPDMRVAIAYCLGYPHRLPLGLEPLDLVALGSLTFEAPRHDVFPCLGLARRGLEAGPWGPVALNAANETAVELFLAERIAFLDIPRLVAGALDAPPGVYAGDLDAILECDRATRETVRARAAGLSGRKRASCGVPEARVREF